MITHKTEAGPESTLNRVSPNGLLLWTEPAVEPGRITTSSPRVFGEFVLLYVPAQVAVYDFNGNLVSTGVNVNCGDNICGGSPSFDFLEGLLSTIGGGLLECTVLLPIDTADCWDSFVFEFDGSTTLQLPALDPTVAIFTHDDGGPIVVALSGTCMTGFRFNAPNLEFLWRRKVFGGGCDDQPVIHGSPANLGGGLLVVANEDGEVTAHDPLNGSEFWKYEAADASFLSTPASFVRPIFVTARDSVHLLDSNGKLITKRDLLGGTQSSFALSANHAYVGTSQGLFTFDFDLSPSFTVDGAGFSYVSTPAIGDDGTVYAVTANGTLRAYSPVVGSLQISFPTVAFGEPADGAVLPTGKDTVFSVDVSTPSPDGFDGETTFSSDIDGDLCVAQGTGPDFSCEGRLTTLGEHVITAVIVGASGALATNSITVEVVADPCPGPGPGVPLVTLSSPADGALFGPAQTVAFEGSATDPEDGSLPDASFKWRSNHDGLLGTGRTLETTLSGETDPCNTRIHLITLEVTDSDGNTTSQEISVRIRVIC